MGRTMPGIILAVAAAGCSTASDGSDIAARSASRTESTMTSDAPSLRASPQIDSPQFVPFPNALAFGTTDVAQPGPELLPLSSRDLQADAWRPLKPAEDFAFGPITLTFDGEQWKVRTCGLDMRAAGTAERQVLISVNWRMTSNPDPGVSCVYPPQPGPWAEFLGSRPTIHRSGEAMVLQRPEVTRPWEPANLAGIPDIHEYPSEATRRENEEWANILHDFVPWADYGPLDSPQHALEEADALIAGEIVGSRWTSGSPRDEVRVELYVAVKEVLSGSLNLDPPIL